MQNEKVLLPKKPGDDDDSLTKSVASTTECTGLTPHVPESPHEVDSFKDIYQTPLYSGEIQGEKEKRVKKQKQKPKPKTP
ncbi:MAG: hypothetical protein WCR95_01605 [Eubacteriales bacterium]